MISLRLCVVAAAFRKSGRSSLVRPVTAQPPWPRPARTLSSRWGPGLWTPVGGRAWRRLGCVAGASLGGSLYIIYRYPPCTGLAIAWPGAFVRVLGDGGVRLEGFSTPAEGATKNNTETTNSTGSARAQPRSSRICTGVLALVGLLVGCSTAGVVMLVVGCLHCDTGCGSSRVSACLHNPLLGAVGVQHLILFFSLCQRLLMGRSFLYVSRASSPFVRSPTAMSRPNIGAPSVETRSSLQGLPFHGIF